MTYRLDVPASALYSGVHRLEIDVVGIVLDGDSRTTIMIPQGSIVKVLATPLNGAIFVDVEWNGRAVSLFVTDVQEHGEFLSGVGATD